MVQLLNEDGSITKRYAYDAFGNEIEKDKSDNNAFRYCGEYYDKETDTVYLRARSYDSGTGRFLTSDTYTGEDENISSLNLYTYCNNDSVNQVDPSGHWGRTDGFGVREFGQSKKDRYVHKSITMEALGLPDAYFQQTVHDFFYKRYMTILEGSILPDYVQDVDDDKKDNKKKDSKKKKKKKKKASHYRFGYIKNYNQYINGKICGFNMLGKKGRDTFHGKCMKYLVDLRNRAMNQFGKSRQHENENYIFLGCVLHAIQDYRAHSYITQLKAYKDKLEREKGYENASEAERAMVETFHKDWKYNKKKGKAKRTPKTHKDNKDNPYMNCVNQNGQWVWVKVNLKNNPRYTNAVNSSRCYIKRAQKILK